MDCDYFLCVCISYCLAPRLCSRVALPSIMPIEIRSGMYRCISGFAYQWLCLGTVALPGGHLLCFLCAQSAPGMHSSAISEATCPLFDVHLKSHQQSPILALKTPSVTSVVDTTCSFDSTTWWVLRLYTLLHYYTTLVWWVVSVLIVRSGVVKCVAGRFQGTVVVQSSFVLLGQTPLSEKNLVSCTIA